MEKTKYKIDLFVSDGSIFGKDYSRKLSYLESNINAKGIADKVQKAIVKIINEELDKG